MAGQGTGEAIKRQARFHPKGRKKNPSFLPGYASSMISVSVRRCSVPDTFAPVSSLLPSVSLRRVVPSARAVWRNTIVSGCETFKSCFVRKP